MASGARNKGAALTVDHETDGTDAAPLVLSEPFALSEFEARMRALLRRGPGSPNPELCCGNLVLDRIGGAVVLNGAAVPLRRRELAVPTALRPWCQTP